MYFKYFLLLALVSEFNCFLRSRCSMEMWCPDDIGRDSWDWVGPPASGRGCFNSPEWGGGSSPVKTEPPQIVLLLLLCVVVVLLLCCCCVVVVVLLFLLFLSVYSTCVYPLREQMQSMLNLITSPHARTWRRGLVQSPASANSLPCETRNMTSSLLMNP